MDLNESDWTSMLTKLVFDKPIKWDVHNSATLYMFSFGSGCVPMHWIDASSVVTWLFFAEIYVYICLTELMDSILYKTYALNP